MIGHIALVLTLLIWPSIGLVANAADISYTKKPSVKIDNQPHTVHLYRIDKQTIAANEKASSEIKKEAKNYPDGLVFAQKQEGLSWWMAIYTKLKGQQICLIYPKKTEGYPRFIQKSGINKHYPLLMRIISKQLDNKSKDAEEIIKNQGLMYEQLKWDDQRETSFEKRYDLVKVLSEGCELRDWDEFLKETNNLQEQSTDAMPAGEKKADKKAAGTSGSVGADPGNDLLTKKIEESQKKLENNVANELTSQLKPLLTEVEGIKDGLKKPRELSLLYWLMGLLAALVLIVIASYFFQYWLFGRQNKEVHNILKSMKQWRLEVIKEVKEGSHRKQVPVRETVPQSTMDMAALNRLIHQSREAIHGLTNNHARFQRAAGLIETISGRRETDAVPVSDRGHTGDGSSPTKRATLKGLFEGLRQQVNAPHPDQVYTEAAEAQIATSIQAAPVLSDIVLGLEDSIDEISRKAAEREKEHRRTIDRIRDEMGRKAADREQEHRKIIDQMDKELEKIKDELKKTQGSERMLAGLKASYEAYSGRDLMAAGYLATNTDLNDPRLSEHLADAIEIASRNTEHRKELEIYVRNLTDLRNYLASPRIQSLPYFGSSGLERLLNTLREQTDFTTPYTSKTPEEALQGQWLGILQVLYRAVLLLETYWPQETDKTLMLRLRRTQATAAALLDIYDIVPHLLQLPVNWQWIEEHRDQVKETKGSVVDPTLEADRAFRNRIQPLSSKEPTFCDIATWGFDLIESTDAGQKHVVGIKSQLLVKEPGSKWSDTTDNPEHPSAKT